MKKENIIGKINTLNNEGSVGFMLFNNQLNSNKVDKIELHFDNDYRGVEIDTRCSGGNPFTFISDNISGGGNHVDIISPAVVIDSNIDIPIFSLISGCINKITNKKTSTSITKYFNVRIYTAGTKEHLINEYMFYLPHTINLKYKIIYIPKFDIYITGISSDYLQDIRNNRTNINLANHNEFDNDINNIIKIKFNGNIRGYHKTIHYCINGIYGETLVTQSTSNKSKIVIKSHNNNIINDNLAEYEFDEFDKSKTYYWNEGSPNEIKLIIDDNKDRLYDTYSEGLISSFDKTNKALSDIMKERDALEERERVLERQKNELLHKIETLRLEAEKMRNEKEANDRKVKQLEDELKHEKTANNVNKEKIQLEREHLKSKSTERESKFSLIGDIIKITASIVVTGLTIYNTINKNKPKGAETKNAIGHIVNHAPKTAGVLLAGGLLFLGVKSLFDGELII